jgi:hypothetical protein
MTKTEVDALIALGKAMVEITTTVRGQDEWAVIPELWLCCMRERDAATARIAALTAECESSAHLLVLASDRATKAEAERDALRELLTVAREPLRGKGSFPDMVARIDAALAAQEKK